MVKNLAAAMQWQTLYPAQSADSTQQTGLRELVFQFKKIFGGGAVWNFDVLLMILQGNYHGSLVLKGGHGAEFGCIEMSVHII